MSCVRVQVMASKPICVYYAKGECKFGPKCRSDHAPVDQARKSGSCTYFLVGQCTRGDKCKFKHGGGGGGGDGGGGGGGGGGRPASAGASRLPILDGTPDDGGRSTSASRRPSLEGKSADALLVPMSKLTTVVRHDGGGGFGGGGTAIGSRTVTTTTVTEEVIHHGGGGPRPPRADRREFKTKRFELAFSFDTTGSMYEYLNSVKATIKDTVDRVQTELAKGGAAGSERKQLRLAVIAHGDYSDKATSYIIKHLDFTTHGEAVKTFVDECGPTGGGDADECYELALSRARKLHWSEDAVVKVLVILGDSNPHGVDYKQNIHRIDWRAEAAGLKGEGITVFPVVCGRGSPAFYDELASITGGTRLTLDSADEVTDLFTGLCLKAASKKKFDTFAADLKRRGGRAEALSRQLEAVTIVRRVTKTVTEHVGIGRR